MARRTGCGGETGAGCVEPSPGFCLLLVVTAADQQARLVAKTRLVMLAKARIVVIEDVRKYNDEKYC